MREREVKLVVDDDFELPELTDAVPGATLDDVVVHEVVDRYHDTPDLRLARWGCTLRHREGEGWTLKIPARSEGTLADREEVTLRGATDAPPARLLSLVSSLTLGESLQEVARLETQRFVRRWRAASDGTVVAELTDDAVVGQRGDGTEVRFREIEIELAPDADDQLLDVAVSRFGEAGAAEPDPTPKVVRVLGEAAAAPPDVRARPLPRRPNARKVIRAALAGSTAQLLSELPVAKLGSDPEGVHQARVAARRLRSDLATFAPLLDLDALGVSADELRRLADDLGGVRDCDVLDAALRDVLSRHPEIDETCVREVLDQLAARRRRARDRLLRRLRDPRTATLLATLVDLAADPPTSKVAKGPAREVMPGLVRKRWKRLDRAVAALGHDPGEAELHDVRIRAKRVRYAAEAVAPAVGKPARRFARQAARIQDALGELNDAAVARAWLSSIVDDVSAPAAFAAGQLAQQLLADARVEDDTWRAAHSWMTGHDDWLT